jgi:hypothetical protein
MDGRNGGLSRRRFKGTMVCGSASRPTRLEEVPACSDGAWRAGEFTQDTMRWSQGRRRSRGPGLRERSC